MWRLITVLACVGLGMGALATASPADVRLLPEPRTVRPADGAFSLNPTTAIVAADPSLAPLADVLRQEIRLVAGLQLPTRTGAASAGQIALQLGSVDGGEEAYRLEITPQSAVVTANTYQGVAWGTATLLQAIQGSGERASLPAMTIEDAPRYPYRGFMKDVSRQDVPIEQLYAAVNLCRLYKVRYLHLHLSDDQAFLFPSTKYPQLGTRNRAAHGGPVPKVYDLQQLKDLVRYADQRGVTLVPEIDGPGHSDAMRLCMPAELDSPRQPGGGARLGLLNMCNERMYEVLDDLLGEVAEVFASSPYIHIGVDEVNAAAIKNAAEYPDFVARHGMKNPHDVLIHYTRRVADMVHKRGKTAIAWEGAPLDAIDPDKVIYMGWTDHRAGNMNAAIRRGIRVIEAPNSAFFGEQDATTKWKPTNPLEFNLQRPLHTFGRKDAPAAEPSPLLLGAQMNAWEATWEYDLPIVRRCLTGCVANAWNPTHERPIAELVRRFEATDKLLDRLIQPVEVTIDRQDTFDQSKGVQTRRNNTFFTRPITLSARITLPGAVARFTTDGTEPTTDSPQFTSPLVIEKDTIVWLGAFDAEGRKLAPCQRIVFEKVNYAESLAFGKPVKEPKPGKPHGRAHLVDGFAKFDQWGGWWGAAPTPVWVQVDLEQEVTIDRIEIFPYWDGRRFYQYTISVSTDEQNWTMVVDQSDNRTPSRPEGFTHTFEPIKARYVKVDVLKNSANPAAHIVDLRVYGP